MDSYEEELAILKAEHWATLQRDLASAATLRDPLKNDRMFFLILLIQARHAKKLSQAELAAKLGMQQSAIARIESGQGNPSLRTLLTLAKALDVRLVLE